MTETRTRNPGGGGQGAQILLSTYITRAYIRSELIHRAPILATPPLLTTPGSTPVKLIRIYNKFALAAWCFGCAGQAFAISQDGVLRHLPLQEFAQYMHNNNSRNCVYTHHVVQLYMSMI